MADTDHSAIDDACRLWYGGLDGVLSTQSVAVPGYPFGSVVPLCVDQSGQALLLLSHLAQHSRNLSADPRCALTLCERPAEDVQQGRRLTCVADCHACADADALARYCRHFPNGRVYAEQLGFRLYRLQPRRFHYNGGFATARWIGVDRIRTPQPFSAEEEQSLLRRLQAERSDPLARLPQTLGWDTTDAPALLALNRWGLTLRTGKRLRRLHAQYPIDDWEALAAALDDDQPRPPDTRL